MSNTGALNGANNQRVWICSAVTECLQCVTSLYISEHGMHLLKRPSIFFMAVGYTGSTGFL